MENLLIHEASPYLLQHAHNPVNWYPWGDEAFEKAKKDNKLVLVSIGYSACHWCHVMEHECFEDEDVAQVMNANFVCIKVDREERPDIDIIYMNAVQIMTGSGGWPLNCFTLPDGRPIYGGTYFPKQQWLHLLQTLAEYFKSQPQKAYAYATELTHAVTQYELIPAFKETPPFSDDILKTCYENWQKRFDNNEGGTNRIPKFPMPNNYLFLLRYSQYLNDWERDKLIKHINLTLTKMAYGGINDQVGGGFARYSTDGYWKVPHFEKMLYDNAQIVSIYSEAYQYTKNNLYKQVVYETIDFVKREMTSPNGSFYSSLDADSEGEEGKYYIWRKEELQNILGKDFNLFAEYFNINDLGLWEEGNYILLRKKSDEELARKFLLDSETLIGKITELKKIVLREREKRIKPGLDNKILTSWNAMMIKGYCDAYSVFQEERFLQAAVSCAHYLLAKHTLSEGGLLHTYLPKKNLSSSHGFLEDYACTIEACLALYQSTFHEQWLEKAKQLAAYTIKHFYDEASGMFYFTSTIGEQLIARKMEIQDNVIPSSNSVMARVLFSLGKQLDNAVYITMSEKMLKQVQKDISGYGSAYSNWAMLMLNFTKPFYEIVIVGKDVEEKKMALSEYYFPNAIFAGSKSESRLPLLENKFVADKTLVYICTNKVCKQPTENIGEAIKLLV